MVGGCSKLCTALADKTKIPFVKMACEVICTKVGIKAFVKFIEKQVQIFLHIVFVINTNTDNNRCKKKKRKKKKKATQKKQQQKKKNKLKSKYFCVKSFCIFHNLSQFGVY